MKKYPQPSSVSVTAVMKANRKVGSKPERHIRSMLHRKGYRFRKNYHIKFKGGSCEADIVFSRKKVAIFIDGCFWHCCPLHGNIPGKNRWYWTKKLRHNLRRDKLVSKKLKEEGWTILRVWEHESAELVVGKITRILSGN